MIKAEVNVRADLVRVYTSDNCRGQTRSLAPPTASKLLSCRIVFVLAQLLALASSASSCLECESPRGAAQVYCGASACPSPAEATASAASMWRTSSSVKTLQTLAASSCGCFTRPRPTRRPLRVLEGRAGGSTSTPAGCRTSTTCTAIWSTRVCRCEACSPNWCQPSWVST